MGWTQLEKAEYAMNESHSELLAALNALRVVVEKAIEDNGEIAEEETDVISGMAGIIRRCMRRSRSCERDHQHLWCEKLDADTKDLEASEFRRRQQAAHAAVAAAVLSGVLVRLDKCERCPTAADSVIAHHHDYDKPLEVEWLCRPCHGKHHAEHGSAA